MKKIFLTAVLLLLIGTPVLADIDLSYELPEQLPTLGPGGAFEIGYLWPALGDFNRELKVLGIPGIGAGLVFGGTIGYSLYPNFQIAYEGTSWGGSSSGIVEGTVRKVNLEAGISSLAFIYKTPFAREWNLSLGLAPGYYNVNYKKEISSGTYHYGDNQAASTFISELTGAAWGVKVFANFKYVLNPLISLSSSIGYQYAKIKELFQAGVRMADAPVIDLSGLFVKVGAQLNF